LLRKVTREFTSPVWMVITVGEGVKHQELEVHPDHFFKIHADPDNFESLMDGLWVGGDTLNCFMEIMSQRIEWGYNNMPHTHKQPAGKRQVWIANSHLLNSNTWDNPIDGKNCGVCGKFSNTKFVSVLQGPPSESMRQKQEEAKAEMRESALSVTDAILTINPTSLHWTYAIVNFQNCVITLDDPCGIPASILGIKKHLGTVRILQRLNIWATTMKRARDMISRQFAFMVRVSRTQVDGYQSGPHTTANILLFAGNLDDKRASTVVVQDIRLWMAYILWLHGDAAIKLPSLNAQQSQLHE